MSLLVFVIAAIVVGNIAVALMFRPTGLPAPTVGERSTRLEGIGFVLTEEDPTATLKFDVVLGEGLELEDVEGLDLSTEGDEITFERSACSEPRCVGTFQAEFTKEAGPEPSSGVLTPILSGVSSGRIRAGIANVELIGSSGFLAGSGFIDADVDQSVVVRSWEPGLGEGDLALVPSSGAVTLSLGSEVVEVLKGEVVDLPIPSDCAVSRCFTRLELSGGPTKAHWVIVDRRSRNRTEASIVGPRTVEVTEHLELFGGFAAEQRVGVRLGGLPLGGVVGSIRFDMSMGGDVRVEPPIEVFVDGLAVGSLGVPDSSPTFELPPPEHGPLEFDISFGVPNFSSPPPATTSIGVAAHVTVEDPGSVPGYNPTLQMWLSE